MHHPSMACMHADATGVLSDMTNLPSPSQSRKRPRNPEQWQKNIAKRKRNSGEEYVSIKTKKTISARKIGPPCKCKNNCFQKVGPNNIKTIFSEYWSTGDWNTQTFYIHSQTQEFEIRHRCSDDINKQRSCSREYRVKIPFTNKQEKVCKEAFANIHGISKSRIQCAQSNKTSSNMPIKDRRGSYGHHNKLANDKILKVLEHIKSFPLTASYYSRKTAPNAKYLDTEIHSWRQMYDLYKDWIIEKYGPEDAPVAEHYYQDVRKQHFPFLRIYIPRTDTCQKCDIYRVRMMDKTRPAEDAQALKVIQDLHLEKANMGYKLPKLLTDKCKFHFQTHCSEIDR